MKKKLGVWISAFVFLISLKIVSAADSSVYINQFISWIESTFGVFFGAVVGAGTSTDFLFAKILLLILLFCVVFTVLTRITLFSGKRGIAFIVAAIVSVLAVRYLQETDFIKGILLPYGALGGAVTIFLPLLVYFFFVHDNLPGSFGRRAGWIVYGAFFITFWAMREGEIGNANWLYTLGVVFVILSFIFDRSIHAYFEYGNWERARDNIDRSARLRLLEDLDRARRLGTRRDIDRVLRRAREMNFDYGDLGF